MNYLLVFRWLAIIWTIIMLVGCLTPHDHVPSLLMSWSDKLLHVAIFALFSVLWLWAGVSLVTVVVAGVFLGALIEVLQYLLPINRSADWEDLVADAVGAIVGVGLAWLIQKQFKPAK